MVAQETDIGHVGRAPSKEIDITCQHPGNQHASVLVRVVVNLGDLLWKDGLAFVWVGLNVASGYHESRNLPPFMPKKQLLGLRCILLGLYQR